VNEPDLIASVVAALHEPGYALTRSAGGSIKIQLWTIIGRAAVAPALLSLTRSRHQLLAAIAH
jgi:hypothetical protein